MPAVLFGSISTLADTSELQRAAFNQAFEHHDLDWRWDRDDYVAMLERSGGADRISEYADSRGESVDAAAVHRTKSALFQQSLATAELSPRPGVVETVRAAQDRGWRLGLVTTTAPENVSALLAALSPDLDSERFDVVVDATSVDASKPDPAAYAYALQTLGEQAADCVAVEDNVEGVQAAVAAGVRCLAFPNTNTAEHAFDGADRVVHRLDPEELIGGAAA